MRSVGLKITPVQTQQALTAKQEVSAGTPDEKPEDGVEAPDEKPKTGRTRK